MITDDNVNKYIAATNENNEGSQEDLINNLYQLIDALKIQKIDPLVTKAEDIKDTVLSLLIQNEDNNASISDLQNTVNLLSERSSLFQNKILQQIQTIQGRSTKFVEAFTQLQENYEELNTRYDNQEKEWTSLNPNQLNRQLEKKEAQIAEIIGQIYELTKQHDSLKIHAMDTTKKLTEEHKKYEELEESYYQLRVAQLLNEEKINQDKKLASNELTQLNYRFQAQLDELAQKKNEVIKQKEQQIAQLNEQLGELQNKNLTLERENKRPKENQNSVSIVENKVKGNDRFFSQVGKSQNKTSTNTARPKALPG